MAIRQAVAIVLCAVTLYGCGTLPIESARQAYFRGDYEQADTVLSSRDIRAKDKLLALMERGSIWHDAGDYRRSSRVLLEAVELLDSTDYVSISETLASLSTNDWATSYRGESSERVWIHTYQIMNFLLLGEYESAAVEARQAFKALNKSADELEHDYFTRALLGLAFDAVHLYNDAHIEYQKLSDLIPENTLANELRQLSARRSGIGSDIENEQSAVTKNSTKGELVIFVASGRIPRKLSGNIFVLPDERISFPVYAHNRFVQPSIRISSERGSQPIESAKVISTDLGSVARSALAARGTRVAARHIARSATKNAIVHATQHESQTAAILLEVLFFALEEADTRAWVTLPAHLGVLKLQLPAGTHNLTFYDSRYAMSKGVTLSDVEIQSGTKTYRRITLK